MSIFTIKEIISKSVDPYNDLYKGKKQVSVDIPAVEIIEINDIEHVNTRYGKARVVNAIISDGTAEMSFVLWDNDIDKVAKKIP